MREFIDIVDKKHLFERYDLVSNRKRFRKELTDLFVSLGPMINSDEPAYPIKQVLIKINRSFTKKSFLQYMIHIDARFEDEEMHNRIQYKLEKALSDSKHLDRDLSGKIQEICKKYIIGWQHSKYYTHYGVLIEGFVDLSEYVSL